ncbi:MAG: phosphatidylglycerol lysyltransferase domain-containing protein [Candidatus Omnitrophota bacterium]
MGIRPYPESQPIELADRPDFIKAFKESPPLISEFTFTNLYAWRNAYKFSVSLLDGMLIVCSGAEETKRFLNPIGKGNIKSAIEKVMGDGAGVFIRLPEQTKSLFDNDSRFVAEPDPDNADYLYNSLDLISLAGRKYDGKRNLIKKFRAQNVYEYIRLDAANAQFCLEFEEAWCAIRDCDHVEGLNNERHAIKDMIGNFSAFFLIAGAIKIKGAIRGLAIAEALNPDTLVLHALKAVSDIPGLYQAMLHEFLIREAGMFRYVNLEQDLGIDGLRKTKLSYHPCAMINKYTLLPVK